MPVSTPTSPTAPDVDPAAPIKEPTPAKSDSQPRAADTPKTPKTPKTGKPPTVDPEAPFGWMIDPATGEKRPKKRPGRQAKTGQEVTPPPARGAVRAAPRAPQAAQGKKDYGPQVADLVQTLWMVGASAPPILGESADIKVKAQTAILKANSPGLIQGLSLAGSNVAAIGKGIDYLTGGPASWIVPATFALLPFVAQSAAVWRSDAAGLVALADSTKAEWNATVTAMMDATPPPEAGHNDGTVPADK